MVFLSACLSVQCQGELLTAGFTNNDFQPFNSVGGISKCSHIEALILNLVFTFHLSDGDIFGDTDFPWSRIGQATRKLQGGSYQRDLIGLCLVFFMAKLMFTLSISRRLVSISIGRSLNSTGGHLHGL